MYGMCGEVSVMVMCFGVDFARSVECGRQDGYLNRRLRLELCFL